MSGRQKIFNLPYPRMANKGLNQQMLVFLDRNLLEIERQLSLAQTFQEDKVKDTVDKVDNVVDGEGNVRTEKLSDVMVGLEHALQLAEAAVDAIHIKTQAITEALLADGVVTDVKLAAGAVTESKTNWNSHLLY
jgi:hypothetical protein